MKRLDQLLNFLEQSPQDAFILFAVAKEYEGLGQTEAALAHYLKLKTADPDYVGLYYHLGKLYEHLENIPEAIQTYKDGMLVANKQENRHAFGELNEALMGIEDF